MISPEELSERKDALRRAGVDLSRRVRVRGEGEAHGTRCSQAVGPVRRESLEKVMETECTCHSEDAELLVLFLVPTLWEHLAEARRLLGAERVSAVEVGRMASFGTEMLEWGKRFPEVGGFLVEEAREVGEELLARVRREKRVVEDEVERSGALGELGEEVWAMAVNYGPSQSEEARGVARAIPVIWGRECSEEGWPKVVIHGPRGVVEALRRGGWRAEEIPELEAGVRRWQWRCGMREEREHSPV